MIQILSSLKFGRWFAALAVGIAVGILVTCTCPRPVRAEVFTATKHSDLQAVYDDGSAASPPNHSISVVGVVVNNPWDMLSYNTKATDPAWQVFVQAVEPGDFGGTALYMRMKKSPWIPTSEEYTPLDWYTEMERLNYPSTVAPLQRGDLIRVDARAPGAFYGGKYNVNEQHSIDPLKNFDITILERGLTPQASLIDLSYLKDSSDKFIFDATRATGGEHYQGSLVHLDNLTLDGPANWALDGIVTVRQGNYTMPLKLGLDPELLSIAFSLGTTFSLTAILDQDDKDTLASPGYGDGYRLWLTDANDFSAVPEPGTVVLAVVGGLLMYPVVRKRRLRRKQ